MPLFYMHLRDGVDVTLDPEGVELAEDAVVGAALLAARDCIAGDVHNGWVELHHRIDVHDEKGDKIHSLAFADAIEIRHAASS